MLTETVVELSRWQFAITAMLHFLFIPLTLGLGLLLAVLESAHALSRQPGYLAQIKFWQRIFAIDFALAMTTRLTVIFQFGSNGSYFSHYVGDIFALPLAIEALTSFFLAATLFGPYWFGRDKLGKYHYLSLSWLLVAALHASAYWIMLSNAWMQNPVGAAFDPISYRLQLSNFLTLLTNPNVIGKYFHTLAASHSAAAATILAIAAWRLRRNSLDAIARSSFKFAAIWGLMAILATIAIPDPTPQLDNPVQNAKLAAITGTPNPALLGNIENHIRSGIEAYRLLLELRDDNKDPRLLTSFIQYRDNLGYALLLKPLTKQIVDAKDRQISLAAQSALPSHPQLLYWVNRLMIGCGILSLLGLAIASALSLKSAPLPNWLLTLCLYLAVLPWLASIAGWFVAEAGKQPWAIAGMLPTAASISTLSVKELLISLFGYAAVYVLLLTAGGLLLKQAVVSPAAETGETV
jgi:cytochrome d ubiquinol oxidase subunit I